MSNEDWLVRTDTGAGILYEVTQNKYAPLRKWLSRLIRTLACFALSAVIFYIAFTLQPDGKHPIAYVAGPLLVAGLFFGFSTIGGMLILIPATLRRRLKTEFEVSDIGIKLKDKLKRRYPDTIKFGDISHIHFGLSGKSSSDDSVVLSNGLAGATAALANESGNRMRREVAETGFGVWFNVKGRDIYLANALTEAQAMYLYEDLSSYIGRHR